MRRRGSGKVVAIFVALFIVMMLAMGALAMVRVSPRPLVIHQAIEQSVSDRPPVVFSR